jgi:hypothetical protein
MEKQNNTSPLWHFRGRGRQNPRCPLCRRALFRPGIRSGKRLLNELQRAAGNGPGFMEHQCRLQQEPMNLDECLERHYRDDKQRHLRLGGQSRAGYGATWRLRPERPFRLNRHEPVA